ncbi:hypothetical protein BECAL_02825 [Bellilinea caldifistulae]|uniref:DUF4180 domain-containing protein n=1 Tax=Bellilinea caldifistulae TaxID=360411 RepID=A0A0P6X0U2_9CHLR|nr:DUF4180 domain-containing protein [Bellilinea caldifistulae]KPL74455.1 hypothetical protein AC812_11550 [Bellilinea caldifistulae]GAP11635.1 hypothetical protein BECAL_02825 [Bellilinea caldifistulae]
MELKVVEKNKQRIVEVLSSEVVIKTPQDALDLIAEVGGYEANGVILQEHHFTPDFFELRSGVAGEILLKFSNYRVKMAVIGQFEKYKSNSLRAFIRESNRGREVFFVPDRETAISKIAG